MIGKWFRRLIYAQSISAGAAVLFMFLAMVYPPVLWLARGFGIAFLAITVVITARVIQYRRSPIQRRDESE